MEGEKHKVWTGRFAQPVPSLIPLVYSFAGHKMVEAVTQNQSLLSHVVIQTIPLKYSHHVLTDGYLNVSTETWKKEKV